MSVNSIGPLKLNACLGVFVFICLLAQAIFAESLLRENAINYRMLGYEAQRKGMINEALNYYQKAVSADPNYVTAFNDLGIIYEAMGETNSAEEAYLKAINLDPSYANAYANLALLYEGRGDYLTAAKYWIKRAYIGGVDDPGVKKAQGRIEDISRIIPQVKELYIHRDLPPEKPSEKSREKRYFDNPNLFFEEALSGRSYSR